LLTLERKMATIHNNNNNNTNMIRLGDLVLKVPLAIGTLQWGTTWFDDVIVNRNGMLTDATVAEILETVGSGGSSSSKPGGNGVTLLDTAEGYGGGTSEKRLGRLISATAKAAAAAATDDDDDTKKKRNDKVIFMTKFLPAPWRLFHQDFEWAVRQSCKRLQVDCIPIYLLHSPIHWLRPIEYWVESAAICKRKGLIQYMGLSNANADQVRRAVAAGKTFDIDIVCNQVHYSLLDYNSRELQEMEKMCRELSVTIIAFTPIGQGLLTDNLTEEKFRANKPAKMLHLSQSDLQPLRHVIQQVAHKHEKTMAQVCLNWCIQHGTIPLVGCRTVQQAQDSMGCLGWSLSATDVEQLDAVALNKSTLDSPAWKRTFFVALFGIVNIVCRTLDSWGFGNPPTTSSDDKKALRKRKEKKEKKPCAQIS
jgi:pyridoxine 4-dehydrogenase